jgi:hypothetical protein
MTQFSTVAIKAMIAAGVAFACQFDVASYGGYGLLDMFSVATDQAKPQYYALSSMIRQYRPSGEASASAATQPRATNASLLSQGALTYCSPNDSGPNEPSALTDGKFGNWGFWQLAMNALPGWCAILLPSR